MVSSRKESGGYAESGRSERSARSLSAAGTILKLPVDFLKKVSSTVQKLGLDRIVDRLESAEKEVDHPSALARNSAARSVQFGCGGPRFICYRGPPEAKVSIPLVLVERSFFDFCLHAAATGDVEGVDVDTAYDLWTLCSRGWEDEEHEMTPNVNDLLEKYLRRIILPSALGQATADGVVDGVMLMLEYKVQPADGYFQALEYFRRRFLKTREVGCLRSHGLLVLVASPYIQAVGVVMDWENEKVLAEPLTDFVNCFGPEYRIPGLAATLRAVRLFCDSYGSYSVDPSVPFIFSSKPLHRFKDKLVFQVNPTSVVKITRTYCEEAHREWAKRNVAPPLQCVEEIGGGWIQVKMEFLHGWENAGKVVSQCAGDPEALSRLTESIRAAALKGHSTGYVHGDMRLPNIKLRPVDGGSFDVMFIDFDWAGETGKARYPAPLNPKLGWAKGAGCGKVILPEHDLHFVSTLAEQLESL